MDAAFGGDRNDLKLNSGDGGITPCTVQYKWVNFMTYELHFNTVVRR